SLRGTATKDPRPLTHTIRLRHPKTRQNSTIHVKNQNRRIEGFIQEMEAAPAEEARRDAISMLRSPPPTVREAVISSLRDRIAKFVSPGVLPPSLGDMV